MTTILPPPWLCTERIALREFVPVDFDDLYRLDSDPQVMRYLNGGAPLSHAEVRATLVRTLRYYDNFPGLGVWRASRRDSGAFIGWFCLKYCGTSCDVEVGYRLVPEAWGMGYATEGAGALVHQGFLSLGLLRVIGITHPQNRASQHVLRKCGLTSEGFAYYYHRRVRLFARMRSDLRQDRRSPAEDPRLHVRAHPEFLPSPARRTGMRRRT
ncbi:MAG: GNAT family N-acetyltransferase [Casimicrobiaceae bacterium]